MPSEIRHDGLIKKKERTQYVRNECYSGKNRAGKRGIRVGEEALAEKVRKHTSLAKKGRGQS